MFLGLTRYQWLVLFAAWLGWGFDVFDGLLFNFVAPLCVPDLLGIDPNTLEGKQQTFLWTAGLTSMLLLGWAIGGILFGKVTDRIGRTRTLLLTMFVYAISTAACAFAPNIWVLALCRLGASLGIGGEWAAGASLVAESLPPKKRVIGGALLYTSAPAGLFLATYVNDLFTRQLDVVAKNPQLSWRVVFLTGLVPVVVAVLIRLKVKEPEGWKAAEAAPRIAELFSPELRRHTLGGLAMALVALITWWSCSAFIPVIASMLAADAAAAPAALAKLKTQYQTTGSSAFNLGGLIGTLLTVPVAMRLGRRPMFFGYFLASAAAIFFTFAPGAVPDALAWDGLGLLLQHRAHRYGVLSVRDRLDRARRRQSARGDSLGRAGAARGRRAGVARHRGGDQAPRPARRGVASNGKHRDRAAAC